MERYTLYRLFYSSHPDCQYLGSTKSLDIRSRLINHKCRFYKGDIKVGFYELIRELELSWDDIEHEILESGEMTKQDALKKETEYQNSFLTLGNTNKLRAYRSPSENKKLRRDYHQKWYAQGENADRVKERATAHYQENKEEKIQYSREYYAKNKERISQRDDTEEHRARTRALGKVKVACPYCGKELTRDSMKRHKRLKICQK